jgi:hypothetical protein
MAPRSWIFLCLSLPTFFNAIFPRDGSRRATGSLGKKLYLNHATKAQTASVGPCDNGHGYAADETIALKNWPVNCLRSSKLESRIGSRTHPVPEDTIVIERVSMRPDLDDNRAPYQACFFII